MKSTTLSSTTSAVTSTTSLARAAVWTLALLASRQIRSVTALRSARLVDLLNSLGRDRNDDEYQQFSSAYDDDVQVGYIQQSLDHFRLEDDRTLEQRYFYTDRFVNPNATREYAFLCVGGEGPALTKAVLVDSVHCTGDMIESARRLYEKGGVSIHLYALEHRYYGHSYPRFNQSVDTDNPVTAKKATTTPAAAAAAPPSSNSPVTNEHLVYLSSRQAQADLAHFVSTQTLFFLERERIPWITFGGSYPGMMAAYARLRFPHLIAAAVSSSAPIGVTLNFPGYKNHVAKVLNDTKVGGSPACLQTFLAGHATLAKLVQNTENHAQLASQFGLCNATQLSSDPRNVELWLGDGVTPVGTQSNDPSCTQPLCNVAKKCAALLQSRIRGKSPVQALASLERERRQDGPCMDLSWEDNLAFLSDVSHLEGGWRSWLWQTCTEFGFYQTCDLYSDCPFGRGLHPLDQDLELCQRVFGVSPGRVALAVEESKQYYGGLNLATTRVLSVNGDVDPWAELALRRSDNDALPALVVPGASHHFWTHPVKSTDSLEVAGARELIYATLVQWLDEIDQEWNLQH